GDPPSPGACRTCVGPARATGAWGSFARMRGSNLPETEVGMATRNGRAEWRGDLQGGSGELTVGDGVFSGNYSFASRFEEGEGTNPEELIAAAHAACLAMALSNELAGHGHPPDSVR